MTWQVKTVGFGRFVCASGALLAVVHLFVFPACAATDSKTTEREVHFSRDVLPILSNKCFLCHGPDASQGEETLRLDSFQSATADLGGYRAIDPEDPEQSELLFRIFSEDNPMPPPDADKQLTAAERDVLARWVRQGGSYEKHWAFVPPQKAEVPQVASSESGTLGAIDRFVLARLRKQQLDFAPAASRPVIARRAALVLTGLPPELPQLDRFLNDSRPGAYRRYVQSLLASPRFGEHQARYWLDAVRYGDTHGLHLDNRRGIYPYRDWVVRALNQNLPLDTFITWQLAGDLLPNPTLQQQVATGFVRLNPTTSEGGALPEEFQMKNNFDRVETLGTALLGMSLNCARCHTHKYDPIQQTEYYRLMAFFNSTAEPAMDGNAYTYGPTVKVPEDQAAWHEWVELAQRRGNLLAEADAFLSQRDVNSDRWQRWHNAGPDERLTLLANKVFPALPERFATDADVLVREMKAARKAFTTTLVAKDLPEPRKTYRLRRGEYNLPVGDPLQPGVLQVMGPLSADAPRNRLGLARWLTSRDHPLVSRVMVNQLWQRVFGEGLVRTPEDFGAQGEQPTHPQLLDWLAVELHDSGWDLKHLLRLMVTSRTFRQSAALRTDVNDPENRLLARGPSFRLDAEVLRDIGLWASQLLDPHMGGEGVKPYQPEGMWLAMAHPASNTKRYVRDQGKRLYRRSLYVYWKRTSPHPMMTLFDAPSRESSCVRRSRTNTSLQSLGLLNETQRIEMARALAERLWREADDTQSRLELLFRLLTSRKPTPEQHGACAALLESLKSRYLEAPEDARSLLSLGDAPQITAFPLADYAAWTQVCATVLASDAAILLY